MRHRRRCGRGRLLHRGRVGPALFRRGAAYAAAERDTDASGAALEWSEHQFISAKEIKPSPVEIREAVIDRRGSVCRIRDRVRLAAQKPVHGVGEIAVQGGLARPRPAPFQGAACVGSCTRDG